jgi:putative solute:sodium symporter small subunit
VHSPSASDPPRWRLVRAVTLVLLAVWFCITFVTSFFARDLDLRWFGWPLNYWIASQGALLVYLLLIGVYAWAMNRLDETVAASGAD